MIIVKLWGGLGNQLFQYAYGYQLSKKLKAQLWLDISWFEKQNVREPEILKFNIKYDGIDKFWESNQFLKFMNNKILNKLIRVSRSFYIEHKGIGYLKETRFFKQKKIEEFNKDNTYLDGYWQCSDYFSCVVDDLRKMFTLKKVDEEVERIGEMLKNINSVAVHIRKGDYPQKKKIGSRLVALDDSYYIEALKCYENKENCRFVIFSNGTNSEIKNIIDILETKQIKIESTKKLSALDEWYLMSCCKNQIIANSTFSWWAAYLNLNPDKVVCAPGENFGNDDIVPLGWVKIM